MNSKTALTFVTVFVASLILQKLFFSGFAISNELVGNIITFLSIVFGFYITSLTIFATSNYISGLYRKDDKQNVGNTLLNTLINNYKLGLNVALLTIVYLLAIQLFVMRDVQNPIYLNHPSLYPFFGLLGVNFYYSYFMLSDLLNVILQDAKNKK